MINNPVTNFSFTILQISYKHIYCTTTCTVEVSVSERVCASYIMKSQKSFPNENKRM